MKLAHLISGFVMLQVGVPREAHAQPVRDLRHSIVEVSVVGPFGEKVSRFELQFLTDDKTSNLALNSMQTRFLAVPYGNYAVVVDIGCCRTERRVVVNTAHTWIQIGVPFRFGDSDVPGGWMKVSGRITPRPANPGSWWAKVEGIFLDFRREVPVDKTGAFSVGGLDMGAYLLQLFDRGKLQSTRYVEVDPKEPEVKAEFFLQRPRREGSRP